MSRAAELELERSLLAGIISGLSIGPEFLTEPKIAAVEPGDFQSVDNGKLLGVLRKMKGEGGPIDEVLVKDHVRLHHPGLLDALLDLPGSVAALRLVAQYAEAVRSNRLRKDLAAMGAQMEKASNSDEAPSEILDRFTEMLVSYKDRNEQTRIQNRDTEIISLSQLLSRPAVDVEWIIEGLLPVAGTSMMAAKPKAGKTTTADTIAAQVACGWPFLGRKTTKSRVLILALEEKDSEIQNRFAKMNLPADAEIYFKFGVAPRNGLAWLEAKIEAFRPQLVVVDPLFKLVRMADGNAYSEVSEALEPVSALARKTGCHLMLVHHQGKGERSDGESVLGSTALFAAVDALLLLSKRDGGVRSLKSVNRYGTDLPETVLTLDPETGLVNPGGNVDEVVRAAVLDEVRSVLLTSPGMTEDKIREHVHRDVAVLTRAIRAALLSGDLVREGRGVRGGPYRYHLPIPDSRFLPIGNGDFGDENTAQAIGR